MLTEEYIRKTAKDALHLSTGGVREDACDVVSNELSYMLEEYINETTEDDICFPSETYAPFRGRKHFVAAIPAEYCTFTGDSGYVLVDATAKQFESSAEEEIPKIAILPPGDARRDDWYDEIRVPALP